MTFPAASAAAILIADFELAGAAVTPDHSGALWLADDRMLVVADLHLEKGSAYAARRVMLPPYDTAATLARLALVILRHKPRVVVALGDSFHDRNADARMADDDRAGLRALTAGRDWIWVAGNHDPSPPEGLGGIALNEVRVGPLTLRHEPSTENVTGEIAGHLHPVARVWSESGSTRRRCFVGDGSRCVLPAFGAYAGGLNIRDVAFAPLFAGNVHAHALGRDKVYRVPMSRCAPD
jgi:DNA ligase-associated metallophosphoesterase